MGITRAVLSFGCLGLFFVIKTVVPEVSFLTIFAGVLPFIATDILRLIILIAFPIIATFLPAQM